MFSRRASGIIVIIIALAMSAVFVVPAFAASASGVASFTNSHRAKNNMPALTLDSKLSSVAQSWSENMAKTGVLKHNPNRPGWENVGMGCGTGGDKDRGLNNVMKALVASPSHNENMLRNHKYMGVGYYYDAEADCTWVTQLFTGEGSGKVSESKSKPKEKPQPAPKNVEKDVKDYPAWTTTNLNVRSGPGTSYQIVKSLNTHSKVTIQAKNEASTWGLIGEKQWVSLSYLTDKNPASTKTQELPIKQSKVEPSVKTSPQEIPQKVVSNKAVKEMTPVAMKVGRQEISIYSDHARLIENVIGLLPLLK